MLGGNLRRLVAHIVLGIAISAVPLASTPSQGASQNRGSVLLLSGVIQPGAFQRFKAELANKKPDLIVVDGPGGRVFEAILIGTEIRRRGLPTLVRRNRSCASACTIVFLSGRTKILEPGASLGMHAATTGAGADAGGTNLMYGYLRRVGMPTSMAQQMATVPPSEIRWLTRSEQKRLGVRTGP